MEYQGTAMSDAISVSQIYTVLHLDLCKHYPGKGEAHPFPEIIYLTRGRHHLLIDEKEYTFCAGQMILYAPDSYHEASKRPPENAEAAILTFDTESELLMPLYNRVITLSTRQRKMLESLIDEGLRYFCGRDPSLGVAGMQLREGVSEKNLWGLKKQIELFLIDVYETDTADAAPRAKDARWDDDMERATAFLSAHLAESLTLADIAAGCSMSVSKLKLLFREKVGMGPIEYCIRLRVERSKALIREGKLNFSQIAEAVGFSSLHYFSRQFKQVTGMSPSEYARMA